MIKLRQSHLILKRFMSLLCLLALMLYSIDSKANSTTDDSLKKVKQTTKINGTVIDISDNMPLPGVNIIVKGTLIGVSTDFNGQYSIDAKPGDVLVFTYVGYASKEIPVGSDTTINVSLEEDIAKLDEVVVVGYGQQKKVTLTGAVEKVDSETFENRGVTNPILALQGATPGLIVSRNSSRPGNEGASFNIRGNTSINGGSSLVVVDGVVGANFGSINPNDIESISILKDAEASIYGARAANGVVLVTTKRGKTGKPKIELGSQVRVNTLGIKPQNSNALEYFNVWRDALESDEAAFGIGGGNAWAWLNLDNVNSIIDLLETEGEGYIDSFFGTLADPNDPDDIRTDLYLVPNDRWDEIYGSSISTLQSMAISGASDKVNYRISGIYDENVGPVDVTYDGVVKYNLRAKVDVQATDRLNVGANIRYEQLLASRSSASFSGNNFTSDPQIFASQNPFGQWLANFNHVGGGRSVVADIVDGGRFNSEIDRLDMLFTGSYKLTDNLEFKGTAAFNNRFLNSESYRLAIPIYSWDGTRQVNTLNLNGTNYNSTFSKIRSKQYGGYLNYTNTFNENHNLTALVGINTENNVTETLFGNRIGFEDQGVFNLELGGLDEINTGNVNGSAHNHEGIYAFLANVTYDYKNKYLLKLIGRRDGSSRFSPENRWDNFASVSAGWVVTNEEFMENVDFLKYLKLRASYGDSANGLVGIGLYDYLSTINNTGTVLFGTTPAQQQTAAIAALTSDDRKWERVNQQNFGIDFGFLNNRLTGTFDYFIKTNENMFINIPFPQQLGDTAPETNNGTLETKGWEVQLNWKDQIGKDFNYGISAFLSDTKDEILDIGGQLLPGAGTSNAIEGYPISSLWVYKTDGIFQTQEEVDEYYDTYTNIISHNGNAMGDGNDLTRLTPGDIRKVDVNGDGDIDQEDVVFVGDVRPHFNFGVNLNANYKGFDFRATFQGIGEQNVLRTGRQAYPFLGSFTNHTDVFLGRTWTPDNTDASIPRSSTSVQRNNWNYAFNDFRVQNNKYLRLKQIEIGYTLPLKNLNIGINSARLYFNGQDLWEISNLDDGFDPEYGSASNNTYPFTRIWTFGVNVNL